MNKIYNSIMHVYNKLFKHDNKHEYMILSCMIINDKIVPLSIAIK